LKGGITMARKARNYSLDFKRYFLNKSAVARASYTHPNNLENGLRREEMILIKQKLQECINDIDKQLLRF
jgi:hypothetical protein